MEIVLAKEKETTGTWRYKENKADRPMTIYLTKEQVKELGSPESIKVTITAVQLYRLPNWNSGCRLAARFSGLGNRSITYSLPHNSVRISSPLMGED